MDREKVIKGLECCRSMDDNCEKCPYNYEGEHGENECLIGQLMSDILELMKEQDEVVRCKDCKHYIHIGTNATGYCTKDSSCWVFRDLDWFCADGERKDT